MKKRILAFVMAGTICLSLAACGGNGDSSAGSNADTSALEARIAELEAENEALRAQISEGSTGGETTPAPEGETISLGAAYTIPDLCEFTVDYADLKKEVLPPNPTSFYTYYQEEDGMTYIDVAISTKNLRTTARRADDFGKVTAVCGTGYEYTGFSTIEEKNGGNFTYTNITDVDPLETAVIHYIISIPNEIADDTSAPITLYITMLDVEYILPVR